MGFGSQLLLLLWKNFVLQKRKICVTVFEILMPIFFAFLLVVIRLLVSNTDVTTDTVWSSFTLDNQQPPSLTKSRVLYAPKQLAVDNLMSTVASNLGSNVTFSGYASESALLTEYNIYASSVWAAIVFDETQDYTVSLPTSVKYKLRVARLKTSDSWRTDDTYPVVQRPGPRNNNSDGGTPNYYATGFLGLQYAVSKAVVNTFASTPINFSTVDIKLQKIPFPPYVNDNLLTVLQLNLPFFLLLGFILNALQLTRDITYEKEKRLRESMKMMGLKTSVYWLSWFLKALVYLLIVCIVFSILFTIRVGRNGKILNESAGSLIFVFLLLYVISIIAFCFMISAFFNTATIGSIAAGLLFFLFYMPFFFLNDDYEDMTTGAKLACCLLNQMAMAFGCYTIGLYEGTGAGATWSTFREPATVDDNFALAQAMGMLVFDTILYFLVAWYVDNVKPGDYGIPKPFYFPFTKTYWCGEKPTDEVYGDELRPKTSRPELFERDPSDLKVGISINKLRKEFGKGKKKKIAVSGTSLNMYEGQITALLGHNGAGKTTTMSMLTGFIPPTSGTASVNGYDIVKNISGVRESIGLCPQHNILFDTLTVEEHLDFYASLKGLEKSKIKPAIDEMIVVLDLESKRNKKSMTLSGGQKRKLSVGIAIIGDSKIVILDEPTSGMDPMARRQTWDILQKFREGRTMVLSTHFMDEADLLGDRIAIMSEGVVKCCGTSLFLKKAYGAGYHLVIVKDKSCNVSNLTSVIQGHVPGAFLESEISAELSYILPFDESAKFEGLFLELENKRQALGVGSFGTSATTMEEVFLKVGENAKDEDDEDDDDDSFFTFFKSSSKEKLANGGHDNQSFKTEELPNNSISVSPAKGENDLDVEFKPKTEPEKDIAADKSQTIDFARNVEKNTGLHLSFQQYYGMIVKKFIHTYRNKIISIVQLAMPIIFTVLALLIEKTNSSDTEEPALTLDLGAFGGTTFIYSGLTTTAAIATTYKNSLTASGHSGDDYNAQTTYTAFDDYLLAKAKSVGQSSFDKSYIVAGDFAPASGSSNPVYTAYFNGEAFHTPAITLNYMMDALLKDNNSTTTSMTVINHPLPIALTDNSAASTSALTTGFSIAFTLLFGMAFLTSSFVLFPIKERFTGAKHLQVVSGVSPFAYWVSNFTWDVINYLVPMIGIIIAFVAFQTAAYVYDGRIGIIILMFLIYGWCCLPFVYLLHYMFTSPATGVVSVTMLNIFSGLVTLIAVYVLEIPSLGTEDIADGLNWIFTVLLPHYNLGKALMDMYVNYEYKTLCEENNYQTICSNPNTTFSCCAATCGNNCFTFYDNYMHWETPGIGRYLTFMSLQGFIYFTFVFLIEYGVFYKCFYAAGKNNPTANSSISPSHQEMELGAGTNDDDDVVAERDRINSSDVSKLMETDALVLKNLSKSYGSFQAVKGISVGIGKEECFGLLGQNGAGKTSTFKMLTGDHTVTSGNAYLNSHDVKQHLKQVQQNVGYCPQFDALIEQMTGRETLTMYARLRGVKENVIKRVVSELIDVMMLRKYADKNCSYYSGGNKRKLSTAIALVGNPPFVLLDEPTTGMDPGARRKLWNVLSQIRASGKTLILTSHSMEECDALCTKIVIMVNGKFVCLGSPQHLKNKFGHGYTLIVRLSTESADLYNTEINMKNFVQTTFPNSKVFDDHQGYLQFQIPDADVPLAKVFGELERAKDRFNLEDYSVHQTTLEQVFLTFTRDQVVPKEKSENTCKKLCCCCGCC